MARRTIDCYLDANTGTWLAANNSVYEQASPPIIHYREEVLLKLWLLEPDGTGGYQLYTQLGANDTFKASVDDDFSHSSEPLLRANDYSVSKTVTMTDSDDKVNCNDHGFQDNRAVWFNSTGSLPSNINAYQTYYVINATTNDFQIAETAGGSAVDFGSDSTATTTAFYGEAAFNVPGDWDDADSSAGKLSIRLNANTLSFLTLVESWSATQSESTAYFEIQIYPAGASYMSGVLRAEMVVRALVDGVQWSRVDDDDYQDAPISDTTLTMLSDLTASIEIGAMVRFTINSQFYIGEVTALTASLLTVSGMTFPSIGSSYDDIDDMRYQVLPSSVSSLYLTAAELTALIAGKLDISLFDANTILKADSDNVPAALTVAEDTIVGRLTGGSIDALTMSELAGILYNAPQEFSSADSIVAAGGFSPVTADTTSAGFQLDLPSASSAKALGMLLLVTNIGANQLTIAPDGSDTVNGSASSITASLQYAGYFLYPVTGGWIVTRMMMP